MSDPREVGGTYLSGYWRDKYTVLAIEPASADPFRRCTVRWEDGRIATHRTPWEPKRDKVA